MKKTTKDIQLESLEVLKKIEERMARLEQILDCCLVNAPGMGNGALRMVETVQAPGGDGVKRYNQRPA